MKPKIKIGPTTKHNGVIVAGRRLMDQSIQRTKDEIAMIEVRRSAAGNDDPLNDYRVRRPSNRYHADELDRLRALESIREELK